MSYSGYIIGGNPKFSEYSNTYVDDGFDTAEEAKLKFLSDLDSIFKKYKEGTLMFWRRTPKLEQEKPFDSEKIKFKYFKLNLIINYPDDSVKYLINLINIF